jgi:FMN phosphatase YigB (HAD superfamily)
MTEVDKKILLLDLGGVVASLGDPVAEMGLSISPEEFWEYWQSSPLVRELEIGKLSATKFLHDVAGPLHEQPGPEFEERFKRWQIRPAAVVASSLGAWASRFHLALLSNTNEIHWQGATTHLDFDSVFGALFLSFKTGHFKPAAEAYTQVIDHYGCDPGDIYFLDDVEKNILAARDSGINAYQVSGDAEVLQAVNAISAR